MLDAKEAGCKDVEGPGYGEGGKGKHARGNGEGEEEYEVIEPYDRVGHTPLQLARHLRRRRLGVCHEGDRRRPDFSTAKSLTVSSALIAHRIRPPEMHAVACKVFHPFLSCWLVFFARLIQGRRCQT